MIEQGQEYVIDKIREQIKSNLRGVEIALEVLVANDPLRSKMEGAKDTLEDCLELIDKYQAESKGHMHDHNKIEKISAILKTAKADPTRDEYAEYYLDAIEEVVRWIQI